MLTAHDLAKASHDWPSLKAALGSDGTGNALVEVSWQVTYDELGHDWHLTYRIDATDPAAEIVQVWVLDEHPGIWIPEFRPWVAGVCEFRVGQGVRSISGGVVDSKWRIEDAGQEYRALLWGYAAKDGITHQFGPYEKSFVNPRRASLERLQAQTHASASIMEPGTGTWQPVPGPMPSREFHLFKVRMISGRRMFRYYYGQQSSPQYDQDKYFDNIYAVIDLLRNDGTTTPKFAGAIVFFDDPRLPRFDINLGIGVTVFYSRTDFEPVIKMLQTFNKGFIELVEMMEASGARFLIGQLRFDTPVAMGPNPAMSQSQASEPKNSRASRPKKKKKRTNG